MTSCRHPYQVREDSRRRAKTCAMAQRSANLSADEPEAWRTYEPLHQRPPASRSADSLMDRVPGSYPVGAGSIPARRIHSGHTGTTRCIHGPVWYDPRPARGRESDRRGAVETPAPPAARLVGRFIYSFLAPHTRTTRPCTMTSWSPFKTSTVLILGLSDEIS